REGLAFTTGDAGALYVTTGPAKDAHYTSKIFDAQFASRWGKIVYRGKGLSFETRSGNTAKPSKGWSSWEKLGAPEKAAGDALAAKVASPPARYFQYRASFAGTDAVLKETSVYFLPQNQRPRIIDVNFGEDTSKRPPLTLQAGATKPRSPI